MVTATVTANSGSAVANAGLQGVATPQVNWKEEQELGADNNCPVQSKSTPSSVMSIVLDGKEVVFRYNYNRTVRQTMAKTIPYMLGILVAIAITTALYLPAALALFFIAGAYISKIALDVNRKLNIANPAYFKATLIACSGLALETIIVLVGRLF
jgi:hypothetical protein